MNHRLVQRALVILMHDDSLAHEFSLDGAAALAPLGLGDAELGAFAGLDARALRTDPLRKRRLLRTLAEEYKASTTLLLAGTRSLAGLEGFCSSAPFRKAVLGDRPLALAFGEFLGHCLRAGAGADPVTAGVVALEATRARCRRGADANARPGVGLAPGVAVLAIDAAVLPLVQAIERWLFEIGLMPQAGLCDDAPRPPAVPAPAGALDHLLLSPAGGGAHVTLAPIDADLYAVLAALAEPRARAEAAAAVARAGVPAARAGALMDSLLLEGLLAEGPPPGAARLA